MHGKSGTLFQNGTRLGKGSGKGRVAGFVCEHSILQGKFAPGNDFAPGKSMLSLLIVCIGNPLRCDDGFASHVAKQLSRQSLPAGIQVVAVHQLAPEMSELASQAETVLFVDAARQGVPGSIKCQRIESDLGKFDSHRLSPEGVLALAQRLYSRCPSAYLLTVVGNSFGDGEGLSAPMTEQLPTALAMIRDLIQNGEIPSNKKGQPD